jgi:chromosome segregation ATPase
MKEKPSNPPADPEFFHDRETQEAIFAAREKAQEQEAYLQERMVAWQKELDSLENELRSWKHIRSETEEKIGKLERDLGEAVGEIRGFMAAQLEWQKGNREQEAAYIERSEQDIERLHRQVREYVKTCLDLKAQWEEHIERLKSHDRFLGSLGAGRIPRNQA